MSDYEIYAGDLLHRVDGCNCGVGGEYASAHESGCGWEMLAPIEHLLRSAEEQFEAGHAQAIQEIRDRGDVIVSGELLELWRSWSWQGRSIDVAEAIDRQMLPVTEEPTEQLPSEFADLGWEGDPRG